MSTYGLLQAQIDRLARSLRITEKRISSSGTMGAQSNVPIYAIVTEIISTTGKHEAKGDQVYYDLDTKEWVVADNGWSFDEDNDTAIGQTNLYSDAELEVGDVGEVEDFQDNTERERWYFKKPSGGSERPIIKTAGDLAFGATLETILGLAVKTEFTKPTLFLGLYPWGSTVELPDNYVFTADVDSSGAYYTEVFPSTMYARPLEAYPAATGITSFEIYASNSTTSTKLYTAGIGGFKLILTGFDFANASQAAKDYYSSTDLLFPVTFSVVDQAFLFTSPLVGD